MMGLGVRRVVPLTLGWVDVPKSVSVDGASGEVLREPVPAVLLDCDGGWLLLDTGFNTALIRDPALRARFHPGPVEQPVLPGPGEPLLTALGAAGLDLADIRAVAISHLHYDHAGGLKHFAGRVPVHIQRAELDVRAVQPARAGGERHLPGGFRRPADRLAAGRRRHRDRARGDGGAHRRAHPGAPEFRGPDGGRRRLRVRLRRGRPDREHRPGGGGGRPDRGVRGGQRRADPQAQADRRGPGLPAGARARPGRVARADRRTGPVIRRSPR